MRLKVLYQNFFTSNVKIVITNIKYKGQNLKIFKSTKIKNKLNRQFIYKIQLPLYTTEISRKFTH